MPAASRYGVVSGPESADQSVDQSVSDQDSSGLTTIDEEITDYLEEMDLETKLKIMEELLPIEGVSEALALSVGAGPVDDGVKTEKAFAFVHLDAYLPLLVQTWT